MPTALLHNVFFQVSLPESRAFYPKNYIISAATPLAPPSRTPMLCSRENERCYHHILEHIISTASLFWLVQTGSLTRWNIKIRANKNDIRPLQSDNFYVTYFDNKTDIVSRSKNILKFQAIYDKLWKPRFVKLAVFCTSFYCRFSFFKKISLGNNLKSSS